MRALAYKWQRVLFACWKNRTPYDEARHGNDLRRHGSPHAPDLAGTFTGKPKRKA